MSRFDRETFDTELPFDLLQYKRSSDVRSMEMGPRVLVVDDDPVFLNIISKTAKRNHIAVTTCRTTGELLKLGRDPGFDVAILDYQFGELTAFQVADLLGQELPVVLVSQYGCHDVHYHDWPFDVRQFVPKTQGAASILNAAMLAGRTKGPLFPTMRNVPSDLIITIGVIVTLLGLALWSSTASQSPHPTLRLQPERGIMWDAVSKPDTFGSMSTKSLKEAT